MRISFTSLAAALPLSVALMAAAPAGAQSKLGIAVVDIDRAIATSNAYTTAMTQMETTYKPQIDQIKSRQTVLEADLSAKRTAIETAAKAAGGKMTPAIQTQIQTAQAAQQSAQAELERLSQPVRLAQAYVQEQIAQKLTVAVQNAMAAAKVDLVVKPEAVVLTQPGVDITPSVKAQLDTLIPSASITPPAGWRPGGQQGAAAAPAAPASPTAKPTGR